MDNGAENYRRFLAGDETGLDEILHDYKDGLIYISLPQEFYSPNEPIIPN